MKVIFDTNILLDLFLARKPFYHHSSLTIALAEQNKIEGWVCGTTVTTIHYLIAKALSEKEAENHIKSILKIFNVCPVNRLVLESALNTGFADYEDAVLHQSALQTGIECILTRNSKDFLKSTIPVYSPVELLNVFEELK